MKQRRIRFWLTLKDFKNRRSGGGETQLQGQNQEIRQEHKEKLKEGDMVGWTRRLR